ncbi:MAG: indolepyruvate ferredoxin oxidoreductase family protein [Acidimicrobiales bacterium]
MCGGQARLTDVTRLPPLRTRRTYDRDMSSRTYQLDDRFNATAGTVHLTGIQAIARVPIDQMRTDRANGLNTAALASGYPGSPLAGLDTEFRRAAAAVDLPLIHQPAVNEELAATAIMGSQLASSRPDVRYDGVIGVWYGKAPGLDRATDALRHGVFAGSSAKGGALAVVGDDPAAKSSTMPSSSDAALVDLHMPVLYPATIAECLELGLHGVAMSRDTGLWSSLKVVTPIADGSGTVEIPVVRPVLPEVEVDGRTWEPYPSAQFLGPRMVAKEKEFHEVRLELARLYGSANSLNRLTTDPSDAWIGIVATGYTYGQVVEALRRMGLDSLEAVAAAGIRLLHLRLPIPFDEDLIRTFTSGLDEVIVVEEKNPTLEILVRDALYSTTMRPPVVGKFTTDGDRLFPSHGRLDADAIAPGLRQRLAARVAERLAPAPAPARERIPLTVSRTPFFCSGCPHNWGTKAPEGTLVGMGTGCHGMTLLMDADRVGESAGITAMGNEGAHWIGMAPFVDTTHLIQNLGDGTYFHSAQLAVQAAIGAGTNITFKLLYNDTVAMTGGQDATFNVGVPELASILHLQGVKQVVITTDDVKTYSKHGLPRGVDVRDRTEIVDVQTELAEIPGVTVLIHHQGCAAETRRDRRRGRIATPKTRVVINHRICEGCGDCGDKSNCLSVQPVETELGRKTRIDQASCNLDLSCLEGDCPAFMTVDVHEPAAKELLPPPRVPAVEVGPDRAAVAIRMTGIGGTGVVTAGQILGTAALLAGRTVEGLDQTGLSQKAGPVVSDVTVVTRPDERRSNLIGANQADVLIAFDLLVASAAPAIDAVSAATVIVASTSSEPTGRQISAPQIRAETSSELLASLQDRSGGATVAFDAEEASVALVGTAATANIMLLGAAVQIGAIPIPVEAIRDAIELNGVAVDTNLAAFDWGRHAADAPEDFAHLVADQSRSTVSVAVDSPPTAIMSRIEKLTDAQATRSLISMLAGDLVAYQDEAYASRFLELLERLPSDTALIETVARSQHHLLAYKDEYEVARLMLSDDGLAEARTVGKNAVWKLHPPMLRALGMKKKLSFGQRTVPAFRTLARAKRFRGSALDPFGRTSLRRTERALPTEFEELVAEIVQRRDAGDLSLEDALRIAALPLDIRGYEHLKERRIGEYRAAVAAAMGER